MNFAKNFIESAFNILLFSAITLAISTTTYQLLGPVTDLFIRFFSR